MATISRGRSWDEAASPAATRLAQRFESAWRSADATPPDPSDFLQDDPSQCSGTLLALLRTDLALRYEAGERVRVESYRERYAPLSDEVLVGLLYEEFCLREEAGESPEIVDYEQRFPDVSAQLREIIDIHAFVGSTRSFSVSSTSARSGWFPEAGQTIGGFRLVEELGRGSFARVFLAEERQLADRPVAVKVTRVGSREPHALARLQHTYIVPVHSYRIDPATDLHLLCMPYFGRVTLAQLLADPGMQLARNGAELLALLDGLRPVGESASPRAEGRSALAERPLARAIAWWGARLAEALQHAHDRGVLHRDVKPSNVLVTSDAMPMLLDFNLSQPTGDHAGSALSASPGGTLAYMAPEQIEAVAVGDGEAGDGRADIYALGVVLYEMLASRPFASPAAVLSGPYALLRMIDQRRAGPPALRPEHRHVPAALEAVVFKCLAPDPEDRYARAGDLAVDLQAVADDEPLVIAREPQPSRALRWAGRNRRRIGLATAAALGLVAATVGLFRWQAAGLGHEMKASRAYQDGLQAMRDGQFTAAEARFALAEEWARGWPTLRALSRNAAAHRVDAAEADRERARADDFFHRAEAIRYRLITGQDLREASRDLDAALAPFHVLEPAVWTDRADLKWLDPARRTRLVEEVNELLFLWVVASDRPGDANRARTAIAYCDCALAFAEPKAPWRALRARYEAAGSEASQTSLGGNPLHETSARACFEWSLLGKLERRRDRVLAWRERAVQLSPDHFWYQFALAYSYGLAGEVDQALAHYDAAVALRPDASWPRFNRAQLYWTRKGAWERALADLEQLAKVPAGLDPSRVRLELGQVRQRLGDFPAAFEAYDQVIRTAPDSDLARIARRNRAKAEADLGATDRALAGYDALIAERTDDIEARLGRALLLMRLGRLTTAETELMRLAGSSLDRTGRAVVLTMLAACRLALGRAPSAEHEAAEALRLESTPARRRLWIRARLAAGLDLPLLDPDDLNALPTPDRRDLAAAADRLAGVVKKGGGERVLPASLTRAALLSALGQHRQALAEADRSVALAPYSARAALARAQVRARAGERAGALEEAERGLSQDPSSPRLRELRGRLLIGSGRTSEGLTELAQAVAAGARGRVHSVAAQTLLGLGRVEDAVVEWSRALADDPENAEAYLGRAGAFARLGGWDNALADLENAADWAGDDAGLLVRVTLTYTACLPARPDRLSRVGCLATRAWGEWVRGGLRPQ